MKKRSVLISHDNSTPGHRSKAHNLAERLNSGHHFKTIHDRDIWNRGERTSLYVIDRRERYMVAKSDNVICPIPASSKEGHPRHEDAEREVNKAIRAGKPVVEIFENGARESPNRSDYALNYLKRAVIHLEPDQSRRKQGQTWRLIRRGLRLLRRSAANRLLRSGPQRCRRARAAHRPFDCWPPAAGQLYFARNTDPHHFGTPRHEARNQSLCARNMIFVRFA